MGAENQQLFSVVSIFIFNGEGQSATRMFLYNTIFDHSEVASDLTFVGQDFNLSSSVLLGSCHIAGGYCQFSETFWHPESNENSLFARLHTLNRWTIFLCYVEASPQTARPKISVHHVFSVHRCQE